MGRSWLLPLYDPLTRLAGIARLHGELLDRADLQPGHRVLEIGCGTGNLLIAAARRQPRAEVLGIDPDRGGLRRARRKAARAGLPVRVERAYADELPLPDDSVDRVLSSLMLHHLDGPVKAQAVSEVRRVLRPGGELHLVDLAVGHEQHGVRAHLSRRSRRLAGNHTHQIVGLLREAGLTDVAETGHGTTRSTGYTFFRAVAA